MKRMQVGGRTIQILGEFRNPAGAARYALGIKAGMVVMGDYDEEREQGVYWVTTMADAQRLERAGYEVARIADLIS